MQCESEIKGKLRLKSHACQNLPPWLRCNWDTMDWSLWRICFSVGVETTGVKIETRHRNESPIDLSLCTKLKTKIKTKTRKSRDQDWSWTQHWEVLRSRPGTNMKVRDFVKCSSRPRSRPREGSVEIKS